MVDATDIAEDFPEDAERSVEAEDIVLFYVNQYCSCSFAITLTALDGSGTRWRATFDTPIESNPVVGWNGAYSLVEIDGGGTPVPGGHSPRVITASPEPVAEPTYVDLVTEEHRAGASYRLELYSFEAV